MQRVEEGLVVISCDFCGTDWDEVKSMIEGHHGSVLCLECLKMAIEEVEEKTGTYDCTLCLITNQPQTLPRWSGPRLEAIACHDCIKQAAGAFDRDDDIDWTWKK